MISTIEEAKRILASCTREEMVDRTFGDVEVFWFNNEGVQVAEGYFGPVGEIVDFSDGSSFTGRGLRYCGTLTRAKRNDNYDGGCD